MQLSTSIMEKAFHAQKDALQSFIDMEGVFNKLTFKSINTLYFHFRMGISVKTGLKNAKSRRVTVGYGTISHFI